MALPAVQIFFDHSGKLGHTIPAYVQRAFRGILFFTVADIQNTIYREKKSSKQKNPRLSPQSRSKIKVLNCGKTSRLTTHDSHLRRKRVIRKYILDKICAHLQRGNMFFRRVAVHIEVFPAVTKVGIKAVEAY